MFVRVPIVLVSHRPPAFLRCKCDRSRVVLPRLLYVLYYLVSLLFVYIDISPLFMLITLFYTRLMLIADLRH